MIRTLRDKLYRILGYLETKADGQKVLRGKDHQVIGYYDPKNDVTLDHDKQLVAHSDVLITLL